MKRKEEYLELVQELEKNAPDMLTFIGKAKRRKTGKQYIFKSLVGLAASFAVFAVTVNFCTPVAKVCAQVPVLKELVKVVAFSPSLRTAVENNYVQPLGKTVKDGDVTAQIEYMIVDDMSVNVFYTLSSDKYTLLDADTSIVNQDQELGYFYTLDSRQKVDGEEVHCCEIMSSEGSIPDELTLHLDVYQNTHREETVHREWEHEYIASMDVTLEFDAAFKGNGKAYTLDQEIELDGKKLTVTDIKVDATKMSIEVEGDEANAAWLTGLDYYIVSDKGDKFYSSASGISSTVAFYEGGKSCFYAESPFFSDAKSLELVIQGANWLDKEEERIKMNLVTGETDVPLPDNVSVDYIRNLGDNWYINVKVKQNTSKAIRSPLSLDGYDEDGKEYTMLEKIGNCESVENMQEKGKAIGVYPIRYILEDYPYEEVYWGMNYTEQWVAEEEIVIKIK